MHAVTMTDYIPISCADYDLYEIAILHHQRLRLTWKVGNVIHDKTVTPLDLLTRNHEEFLICQDRSGDSLAIRLDYIRKTVAA